MECDGYIFPSEFYDIPGVLTFQDVGVVEQYVCEKLCPYQGEKVKVYINGGLAVEILCVIQASARLNIDLGVVHYNKDTALYDVLQEIRWNSRPFPTELISANTVLCEGRHVIKEEAIFAMVPKEKLFDFTWQEKTAEDFFRVHPENHFNIYLSGLTSIMLSTLNAAEKMQKYITWYHYDYDTESYFAHPMI